MSSEWKIEQTSEDFYDYSRNDYDYLHLKLDENFEKAPPISVSEYRARTLEVLPRGIFDEKDVPGIRNSTNRDVFSQIPERFQEQKSNDDNVDQIIIKDIKPIEEGNTNSSDQNLIKQTKKLKEQKSNDDNVNQIMINDIKPIQEEGNTNSSDQNIIKQTKQQQPKKKKKIKFKRYDLNSPSHSSNIRNQPWNPNFADKFKNNDEFPPL